MRRRCGVRWMAKRIDGQMQLRTFLALGSVVGAAGATLGRRAQSSTVDDGGGRLRGSSSRKAQDNAQILGQGFKATRAQPPLRLLINDLPRRRIVRHPAPGRASLPRCTAAVEHLAKRGRPLRGVLGQKCQIGGNKRPLVIGNVRRIRLAGNRHPANSTFIVNQSLTAFSTRSLPIRRHHVRSAAPDRGAPS